MRQMKLLVACLMFVSASLAQTAGRNYEADPALYDLMDGLDATFFTYTGHPSSIYWPKQVPAAPHLTIYAPDTQTEATNRITAAYQQGGQILEDLFQASSLDEVKVFVVEEITNATESARATTVSGELVILVEIADYTEHSFLHEYMHILQRMTDSHPYADGLGGFLDIAFDSGDIQKWYVEKMVRGRSPSISSTAHRCTRRLDKQAKALPECRPNQLVYFSGSRGTR